MTQDDQEREMKEAVRLLGDMGSTLGVDRCRHATITETTLWLFEHVRLNPGKSPPKFKNAQVGTVRHNTETMSTLKWEATRMMHGLPAAIQSFSSMSGALAWIDAYEYGRRNAA